VIKWYDVLALGQFLNVLFVHLVEFSGCLEGFLQLEDPGLEHLDIDLGLFSFFLALFQLHLVNQAVLTGFWAQMVLFLLPLTHVPLVHVSGIGLDRQVGLLLNPITLLVVINVRIGVEQLL
jgi:hypothetical protein